MGHLEEERDLTPRDPIPSTPTLKEKEAKVRGTDPRKERRREARDLSPLLRRRRKLPLNSLKRRVRDQREDLPQLTLWPSATPTTPMVSTRMRPMLASMKTCQAQTPKWLTLWLTPDSTWSIRTETVKSNRMRSETP